MRSRNLKPGFFKNEDLVSCQPLARILFAGLWCLADREGRLEDRPIKIKLELLPGDNCNIDTLLAELCEKGLIRRYKAQEKAYIDIPTFSIHQNPHKQEKASIIPKFGTSSEQVRNSVDPKSESVGLIPDSFNKNNPLTPLNVDNSVDNIDKLLTLLDKKFSKLSEEENKILNDWLNRFDLNELILTIDKAKKVCIKKNGKSPHWNYYTKVLEKAFPNQFISKLAENLSVKNL